MPHVEQQSHGCTTLASKHANHLTTSKVRAPLLRVHTTLYDARTNDRETQCDRKRRTRSPLNFKHVQKSDATVGERKIACKGSDSSCNVGEPSCECQKAGSQSVLKWSCANCERGLNHLCRLLNTCTTQVMSAFKLKTVKDHSHIIHIYSGITRGKVLKGQLYTQRLQKLIYLYLSTNCFMKISLQSSGPLARTTSRGENSS